MSLLCYAANIVNLPMPRCFYPVYFQPFNVVCTAFGNLLYIVKNTAPNVKNIFPNVKKHPSERESFFPERESFFPERGKEFSGKREHFPERAMEMPHGIRTHRETP